MTAVGPAEELWARWTSPQVPLRLGVSSCLVGEPVRFDGGHCRNRFVAEELGGYAEFVAVDAGRAPVEPLVGGLQPDDRALAIDALERGLALDDRHDGIAVARRLGALDQK